MTEIDEKPPKISVVLPVHNADPYLAVAIDSLLAQTFKDFEIIAINDGSADRSGEILNEYALQDSRIRVFHRAQRGLVVTLNEGIDLARGEWIARMDADDIALPRRFELQLERLSRTDADFCGGAVQCFGNSRMIWHYPESNEACGVQLLFGVPVAHPAVIGRASCFRSLRYDSRYTHAEDYDLWQRAFKLGYKFVNLQDIVLHYRVHEKQVSSKHNSEQIKMADAVRNRHWACLCPDLGDDWFENQVSKFGLGGGNAGSLMEGMLKVLSVVPHNCHDLYLRGCLRIFLRVARRDLRSAVYWVALHKKARSNSWLLKLSGVFVLAIRAIIRFDPEGRIYAFLRTFRNQLARL